MVQFAFKIFADAASCEKGDWEHSRIKISRMICEPRKPRNFSYSKDLRYTVCNSQIPNNAHSCGKWRETGVKFGGELNLTVWRSVLEPPINNVSQ